MRAEEGRRCSHTRNEMTRPTFANMTAVRGETCVYPADPFTEKKSRGSTMRLCVCGGLLRDPLWLFFRITIQQLPPTFCGFSLLPPLRLVFFFIFLGLTADDSRPLFFFFLPWISASPPSFLFRSQTSYRHFLPRPPRRRSSKYTTAIHKKDEGCGGASGEAQRRDGGVGLQGVSSRAGASSRA